MAKQPPAIANPAATQSVNPATQSETSTVNNAASDKQVKRMIAGNFMFSPADLINFEEQLDYIEKTFWIAASLTKTDPFSKDFEKKLFDLVCLSRVIQATLVVKNKSNEGTDLPSGTLRLSKVWQQFAGRGPYYYGQLRCLSRRSYGLYNNSNTSAYIQWLEDTMIANIDSFKSEDESAISAKLSDYYMAMKDLRCSIVDVAKQNIFDKNPQLSKPDKSSSISARKATTATHKKRK